MNDLCDIYCGDSGIFTREELDEFTEEITDSLHSLFHNATIENAKMYIEDKYLDLDISINDLDMNIKVKIDYRQIQKPADIEKYKQPFIEKIVKESNLVEQMDEFNLFDHFQTVRFDYVNEYVIIDKKKYEWFLCVNPYIPDKNCMCIRINNVDYYFSV